MDDDATQVITSYRHYKTDQFFDTDGDLQEKNGEFTKNELELYAQYGLTSHWTIGVALAASSEEDSQQLTMFNPRTNQNEQTQRILQIEGLSRIEPFARYQLYRDNIYAVALQPTVKLPSLYANELPAEAQPDEWEAELALLSGMNFTFLRRTHFAEISGAYRHRQGKLGDQTKVEARAGLTINDQFVIMPEVQWTQSIDEINNNFATLGGSNNFDLFKAQLSGIMRINNVTHLQAGGFRHVSGANTGGGGGFVLSLWRQF